MAMKKCPALEGLDYVPVIGGDDANLSFGVVRRQINNGPVQTVPEAVLRRLNPGRKVDVAAPWTPHCYRWDVLLPPMAQDDCLDPKRLCERYEEQSGDSLKDLIVMMTLRFPDADRLHIIWEEVRSFARERLCRERNLAVVAAFHLPAQNGSTNPPHIHLMALAKTMKAYGFCDYVRPLAADAGKAIFAAEWADWQTRQGRGVG